MIITITIAIHVYIYIYIYIYPFATRCNDNEHRNAREACNKDDRQYITKQHNTCYSILCNVILCHTYIIYVCICIYVYTYISNT